MLMTNQGRQCKGARQGVWLACGGVVLAAALLMTVLPGQAAACSCLQPTVESSYNRHSDVVTVQVTGTVVRGKQRLYSAQVLRVFKGCLQPGKRVLLATSVSSAACGITLRKVPTLIAGSRVTVGASALPALQVGLCDYNVPVADLTAQDRAFLEGRTVCCDGECACADGSAPVNCFVDPCQVAPPCDEGACVANYCGGCNAEFYDDNGYGVCGDAQCADLADEDFGPCEAILGYGVVDGTCALVSGCDAGQQPLFSSLKACHEACSTVCSSTESCPDGLHCNMSVCLSPPVCSQPGVLCPAVCYGYCDAAEVPVE